MRANPTQIEAYPLYDLMFREGNVGGEIGLLSRQGLLEYYVHYEIRGLPALGWCATQVKPWRSRRASVAGIASRDFGFLQEAHAEVLAEEVGRRIQSQDVGGR